jgi:tetratricopeptide (TPR) repeat protein
MPAVAVLAVVHLACLMGACDRRGQHGIVRSPVVAILAAIGLVGAGVLIAWDAWSAERAELVRSATVGLTAREQPTPDQAARAVRLLENAVEARPGNALYLHELGQAYLALALTHPIESDERNKLLREALRHWRAARDLSPMMAPTHARLGRYRDLFDRADLAIVYFQRARSLLPTDSEIAYFCGQARWETGDRTGACADWKSSLTATDRFLEEILTLANVGLSHDVILRDVLPDQPAVIYRAAELMFPEEMAKSPARLEYLAKARDILVAKPGRKTAIEWELEARVEQALDRPQPAIAAYRRALGLAPRQTAWRRAFAELLYESGEHKEAIRELETVVAQEPRQKTVANVMNASERLAFMRREIKLKDKP